MKPLRFYLDQARRWGPLGVSLFALACVVIFAALYIGAPRAVDIVLPDPPAVPVHDHDPGRGPDDARGALYGAADVSIPRPALSNLTFYGSANWSARGIGNPIQAIVVHVTGPGTCPGMRSWFRNPAAQSSAHFGVCKDGSIEQYVELGDRAWHAGIVQRPNMSNALIADWVTNGVNPNARTVGIEVLLEPGEILADYPAMQASLRALLKSLGDQLAIPLDRAHVIGHNEIDAVNRSSDPICCIDLAAELAALKAPAAPIDDWGAYDPVHRNRWNNRLQLWVNEFGNMTFDPNEGFWRCHFDCPEAALPIATDAPVNGAGLWEFVTARFAWAPQICAYEWPCGEALRVVYGPTPPNDRAPAGCPNGESSGNALAGYTFAGLFQLGKTWHEARLEDRGWSWDPDVYDAAKNTAIAFELWSETEDFRQWSCRP